MSKEQFKAQLIFDFIEDRQRYPDKDELSEIQELADFAFNGE